MNFGDGLWLISIIGRMEPGVRFKVRVLEEPRGGIIRVAFPRGSVCGQVMAEHNSAVYRVESRRDETMFEEVIADLKPDWVTDGFFREEAMIPKLTSRLRYECLLPADVLGKWAARGILKSYLIDWYYGCRECGSVASVRTGCGQCLSPDLEHKSMIRHQTCGYVDFSNRFDEWMCPGCGGKLVTGENYDRTESPGVCRKCRYVNDEPVRVATCLMCDRVTPLGAASEVTVFGYRKPSATSPETFLATS